MNPRLVVIGDSMLDIDIDGTATRLSPEAPVPVVDGEQLGQRPGGAGLAAVLGARHGADVTLLTAIGDDEHGRTLRRLLSDAGVKVVALPVSGSTACKTRVRANGQNVVRLDQGTGTAGTFVLSGVVQGLVGTADAVVVADYGKGMCADEGVRTLLTAVADEIPVIWDPHPRGSAPTSGTALVTPNEAEAQHFSQVSGETVPTSAEELRARWDTRAVCVTLGRRGAVLATGAASCTHLATAQSVAALGDTCGAGDRFAVAAAMALAEGADVTAAVTHAVDAATRFVAAGGAGSMSTITALPHALGGSHPALATAPITEDVGEVARQLRRSAGTLVATGGCFDLLHTGHVRLLHRARQLGGALVVLLNSDDSVRALKGPTRPVMPAQDRARVLAALACVDAVCIFDELSPETALATLRPDIWVKGGDYTAADLPEADVVRAHGGDVVLLPTVPGYSSSRLIAAARS